MRFCRLLGVFAVLVIMESAGALSAQPAGAAGQVSTASGTTIGPVQISVAVDHQICFLSVAIEQCFNGEVSSLLGRR